MKNNRLFVYGILRRGFELDLTNPEYGCKFLGEAQINGANLYRIGSGVGLRLVEDPKRWAHGELFEIPHKLWRWLDQIEQNGYCYTRKIVKVEHINTLGYPEDIDAWIYEHTFPGFEYKNLIESGKY